MTWRLRKMLPWLTLDMVVFLILNIIFLHKLQGHGDILESISFLKLVIFGLAAYRLANIFSNELITKPLRAPFVQEIKEDGKTIEVPKGEGFVRATGSLIYCPSCSGVWLTMLMVYAYAFWPEPASVIILILALSGIERIVSRVLVVFRRD
jgi:hypothetical protein